jgi:hypothetical protein
MVQCKIWDPAFALSTEADFKKAQPAKTLCVPYYAYVFSSTKLEIRAEKDLPGIDGGGGEKGEGGGQCGEMTQTMYAHVNNEIKEQQQKKRKLKREC